MARNDPRKLPVNLSTGLTPMQIGQQRRRIAEIVEKNLDVAQEVLAGTKEWNNSQVRVFTSLLNKVIPDISVTAHLHEHVETDPKKMSREELERMAVELAERTEKEKAEATKKAIKDELDETIGGNKTIDADYTEIK